MHIRNTSLTLILFFMIAIILTGCENYAERTHKSWAPPPSAPVYDDSTIFARITTAVQSDPALQGSKIDIKVQDGTVTLSGTVSNEDQLTRVNMHTWIVDGVKKVDNQIVKN
ncbi:BON domain-containing protein [Nitrosomonas sp. JL21]|uniref:BON domain-containing protein n=1 Tax=Nitrosomonas sp. JL21 TaxID=153949 RepID=UPI0013717DF6|nr:BON domain-containing protein [Nitrosomonas sp. JL21]MBL8497918.1 BON domain-containing protein [Nitrosomonas sp.]MXS78259.1 BON domain-containing protein [Nitrosomonas sp. JL21]